MSAATNSAADAARGAHPPRSADGWGLLSTSSQVVVVAMALPRPVAGVVDRAPSYFGVFFYGGALLRRCDTILCTSTQAAPRQDTT
jgi:hypothetical protein